MKVVCDSTVLIGLAKIEKLGLLEQIYGEVYIPEAVYIEVVNKGKKKPGAKEVAEAKWLKKELVKDRLMVDILAAGFGRGEAEVLLLGKELGADWLLIDDKRARVTASLAGFRIIGLAGILLLAKHLGLITSIKPFLEELRDKNFRLDENTFDEVLKKAGEY